MAHTRQYGQGMGHDRAVAVLREHAGTQWDADVVQAVIAVAIRDVDGVLDSRGRQEPAVEACDGESLCGRFTTPADFVALGLEAGPRLPRGRRC